jgi:hypothetical protein
MAAETNDTDAFIKRAKACFDALWDNLAKTDAVLDNLLQAGPLPESTLKCLETHQRLLAKLRETIRESGDAIAARLRSNDLPVNPPTPTPDAPSESN